MNVGDIDERSVGMTLVVGKNSKKKLYRIDQVERMTNHSVFHVRNAAGRSMRLAMLHVDEVDVTP